MYTADINKAIDRMFYAAMVRHKLDADQRVKEAYRLGFFDGAKYTVKTTSELSPHIAKFADFVMWVMDRDDGLTEEQEELPF